MKQARMLEKAIRLAASAHANQMDKSGMPYILHPLRVMSFLKGDDLELKQIAILHDIIEDTLVTEVDLEFEGFSPRVVAGVVALTKIKGEDYEVYKKRVKNNADAIRVKMADLRHNMDLRRLVDVTVKDLERAAKYMAFYKELEALVENV